MKFAYAFLLSFALLSGYALSEPLTIMRLSSYQTGVFDEGGAEIAAFDPVGKKLYATNAHEKQVMIIDYSNPINPTMTGKIDISVYGKNLNGVAFKGGVLAVAVEADPKQDNGFVVFFDAQGNHLKTVEVGALPDMVMFGKVTEKVFVACEGEPDDDYVLDPLGSVAIIDYSNGIQNAYAMTAGFEAYNDKKYSLLNKGVRIFGPNASVAQDLEPEYIALNSDETIAYAVCQENNAFAVIDVETAQVLDILPTGYKFMPGAPILEEFNVNELANYWPELGTPIYEGGETVMLGGFSGLWLDEKESTADKYCFYTIPDRGPNAGPVAKANVGASQNLRPFKLPDYQARIVKFYLNLNTGKVEFEPTDQIFLTTKNGEAPISGKGNIPGFDEVPVTYTDAEIYTNVDYEFEGVQYHKLPYDRYGADFEGIVRDNIGNFWMCDEYRPAIYQFAPNGMLIERFVPEGCSQLGYESRQMGYYGAETLPAVYNKRWANRGFEAVAYDFDRNLIYAFIQSPMYNPSSATKNNSDVIRILAIDLYGTPVAEYVYLLERNRDSGYSTGRTDKIGDAVFLGDDELLVIERDSGMPGENESKKYIYHIDLTNATNILEMPISSKAISEAPGDKTLEMMTAQDLHDAGISPVFKRKVLNLPSIGYLPSDKAEGLATIPGAFMDTGLFVMNDNDFGLAGAGVTDACTLGRIMFNYNYGFDASDKDDMINISFWPTMQMLLPDAIVGFERDGMQFVLTANEGDSRDYDGYSEEERVEDLNLDPAKIGDIEELQKEENLGRLKVTSANGDIDGDGYYDYIYNYGGRSLSIFDLYGNMVWDSGDMFEQKIAEMYPDYFNFNNDENDSFDKRSDDKGPEPEGITMGKIDGEDYVFICMERIGGFFVFKINDFTTYDDIANAIEYVTYYNNRNFTYEFDPDNITPAQIAEVGDLGPEAMVFISKKDSPVDAPMLITTNEITGSVTAFALDEVNSVEDAALNEAFVLRQNYPNPFGDFTNIAFDLNRPAAAKLELLDANGSILATILDMNLSAGSHNVSLSAAKLPSGVYFVRLTADEQSEMIKTAVVK